MAIPDAEVLFDPYPPTREWEENYFAKFKTIALGLRHSTLGDLQQKFEHVAKDNFRMFIGGEMSAFTYSHLLTIIRIFEIFTPEDPEGKPQIAHLLGHLVEASITKDQENEWGALTN